jgi:hypothetical protein
VKYAQLSSIRMEIFLALFPKNYTTIYSATPYCGNFCKGTLLLKYRQKLFHKLAVFFMRLYYAYWAMLNNVSIRKQQLLSPHCKPCTPAQDGE